MTTLKNVELPTIHDFFKDNGVDMATVESVNSKSGFSTLFKTNKGIVSITKGKDSFNTSEKVTLSARLVDGDGRNAAYYATKKTGLMDKAWEKAV